MRQRNTAIYTRARESRVSMQTLSGGRCGAPVVAGAGEGREIVDFGATERVSLRVPETGGDRESRGDK